MLERYVGVTIFEVPSSLDNTEVQVAFTCMVGAHWCYTFELYNKNKPSKFPSNLSSFLFSYLNSFLDLFLP